MTSVAALDRFLQTDPADVGCDKAMELMHVCAEVASAGVDAKTQYPGIVAHLGACGSCGEDFDGLLAAIASDEQP
jgi:hypothetical protein